MFKGISTRLPPPRGDGSASNAGRSIYAFIWGMTRKSQLTVVLMALLVVPVTIAPLELQKRIIDQGVLEKNLTLVILLLGAYVGVAGAQSVLLYFLNMQEGRIQEVLARRLRHRILRLIRRKRRNEAPDVRGGTIVTVYSLEVDPIGEFAGQAISVPIVEGGIFLAVAGYMIFTEPLLAAVALIFFIPQVILIPVLQHKINNHTGKRIKLLRQASEEALGLIDGRKESSFPFVATATRTVYSLRLQIYRLKYFMKYAVLFLIFSARIAVLGVGGYMVMQDQTGIGVVVAFMSGLDRLTARWSELVTFFRRMSDARLKYNLVFDILRPAETARAG